MPRRIAWTGVAFLAVLTTGAGLKKPDPDQRTELREALPETRIRPIEENSRDWPMFRHDPCHSGYTSEKLSPPLALDWKYSVGRSIVSSPAVVRGRVYFGSRDSTLHALDAATGKVCWRYKTGGWIDSSPAIWGRLLYFASRDGFIYALSPLNGRVRWKRYTGATDCSSPALAKGMLYLGSGSPNIDVLALNSHTGRLIWTYQTDQPIYSSPAVKDRVIYIGSNDGKFYALSKSQSPPPNLRPPVHPRWAFQTGGGIYFSSPAISDSLGYCIPGNYDKRIYCLRLSDGSVKWSYEVKNSKASKGSGGSNLRYAGRIEGEPSILKGPDRVFPFVYVSSAALAHGMVYFVSGYSDQSLYALDALDGSLRWSQPIGTTIGRGYSSSPAVADSILYLGSGGGRIYAFNAITGSPLWSYDAGSPIISSPAVANGRLYIGTWGGDLYCFQPSGKPLASAAEKSAEPGQVFPKTYVLLPSTPNPFTTTTTIRYCVPGSRGAEVQRCRGAEGRLINLSTYQRINCSIYDLAGRLVKTLVDERKDPGYHAVTWDGTDCSGELVIGGVYFYQIKVNGHIFTQKLILLR